MGQVSTSAPASFNTAQEVYNGGDTVRTTKRDEISTMFLDESFLGDL